MARSFGFPDRELEVYTPGKPQSSKSQGQAENWPAGGSWSSQVSTAQSSESRRMTELGGGGGGGCEGAGRAGERRNWRCPGLMVPGTGLASPMWTQCSPCGAGPSLVPGQGAGT